MKKPYMCTIIGSSGRDCVLIVLLQLYCSKAGLFEGGLNPLSTFMLDEEPVQY